MTTGFCTLEDVQGAVDDGTTVPDDCDKLILFASYRIVDWTVLARYRVNPDGTAYDPNVASALREACAAQVAWWLDSGVTRPWIQSVGSSDASGQVVTGKSGGGSSLSYGQTAAATAQASARAAAGDSIAPLAAAALLAAGLLGGQVWLV